MTVQASTAGKTNTKAGSTVDVPQELTFDELWAQYPDVKVKHIDADTGLEIFDNHCAINVSEALYKNGIELRSFTDTRCWSCPRGTPGKHVIRAQEMADWLESKRPLPGVGVALRATGETFAREFEGKRGIIFFKDFWRRSSDQSSERTGDHIDLWDDGALAGSGVLGSFVRVTLGISWDGWFSDFELSNAVWLWEMT